MNKIHQSLEKKYLWYSRWHQHPKHQVFHWLFVIVFALTSFSMVRVSINKSVVLVTVNNAAAAAVVFDDFERQGLGPDWGVVFGNAGIVNNSDLGIMSGAFTFVEWIANSFADDQFSEGVISLDKNPSMLTQVFVRRRASDGARYGFHYNSETPPFKWDIKYDGTSTAQTKILASTSDFPGPNPGDTLRVEAVGNTINGYLNGQLILSTTDVSAEKITSGKPGLAFRLTGNPGVSQPEPVFESWTGGSITTDFTPPVVSITSPVASATLSGTTTITTDALDNVEVVAVQFKIDGLNLNTEVTTQPYSINWDTVTVSNGTHTISAIARDSVGNTATATTSITVNNSISSQPVGSWNLNDGLGTTATDISGNQNNGTLVGGASWISGKTGKGINLNGVDSYVTIPDSTLLDNMKAITVSAWVNLAQLPTQNYVVIGKDSNGGSYRITIGPNGKATFVVNTINNTWYSAGTNVNSTTFLPLNTWKHIVGTYNGNRVRIYIDGVLQGSDSQPISGNIINSAASLRLGYKSSSNIDYMKGIVDEVSVYSIALSPAEVKALYDFIDQNADITTPAVSITAPLNNSNVSGVTPINVHVSDASAISKVEFYVDGNLVGNDVIAPYSWSWDTTSYSHNSSHTILVKAYDSQNNIGETNNNVNVTDITVPAVSITAPTNNSQVSRNSTVIIQATASDISGISKVEFYINNTLKCTDTVTPYSCTWKVPNVKKTTYSLQAKAYDTANNVNTSSAVKVISN